MSDSEKFERLGRIARRRLRRRGIGRLRFDRRLRADEPGATEKEELERLREIAQRRGKRREVGPLELDDKRLREEAHEPLRDGPGEEPEPGPVAFEVEERRSAGINPRTVPQGRPRWAIELVEGGVSRERMLEELVRRVRTEPNEKLYRQAELMLRDLTRDERGKALVSQFMTQDLVTQLTTAEAEEGDH